MSISEKTNTCVHPPCSCTAGYDGEYCSEYCANEPGEISGSCRCGHPECIRPSYGDSDDLQKSR